MSTQQEIDLEARIAALEQQIAEMAAKINPLYAGGMDRYIHSGYVQWDGIQMRFDNNGQQFKMTDGSDTITQWFVPVLSDSPDSQSPQISARGGYTGTTRAAYTLRNIWDGADNSTPASYLILESAPGYARASIRAYPDNSVADYAGLTVSNFGGSQSVFMTKDGVDTALGGGGLKTSGGGYYLIPAGPSIGTGVTSSASADTYGSWTQMRAASGNALYIVGVEVQVADANDVDYVQVDIGTGGAGSETSVGEAKIIARRHSIGVQWGTYKIELPYPIPVAASTRIACRTADDVASAYSHVLTLHVIDQADLVSI